MALPAPVVKMSVENSSSRTASSQAGRLRRRCEMSHMPRLSDHQKVVSFELLYGFIALYVTPPVDPILATAPGYSRALPVHVLVRAPNLTVTAPSQPFIREGHALFYVRGASCHRVSETKGGSRTQSCGTRPEPLRTITLTTMVPSKSQYYASAAMRRFVMRSTMEPATRMPPIT